jgi:hypothetical protein
MVTAARDGAAMLLSKGIVEQTLIRIVLHHQALTAKPLFDIFRAVIMRTIEFQKTLAPGRHSEADANTFKGVLGQIHREYEDLAYTRNNLLHATWYVGYASEDQADFSEFLAHKQTVNKSGAGAVDLPKTAKELDELSERCNKMTEWIRLVFSSLAFSQVDAGRISKLFRYNEKSKKWEDARPSTDAPHT